MCFFTAIFTATLTDFNRHLKVYQKYTIRCFTEKTTLFNALSIYFQRSFNGGRGWIRTTEAEKQQIYSLPPLATRELAHMELVMGLEPATC